jgi:hypothetical protein
VVPQREALLELEVLLQELEVRVEAQVLKARVAQVLAQVEVQVLALAVESVLAQVQELAEELQQQVQEQE